MTREKALDKLLDLMLCEEVGEHGLDLIRKIYDDFDNIFSELMDKSTAMAEELIELDNRTCENCKYYKNEMCDNFHNAYPGYEFNEYLRPPDKDFGCNQWEVKDE